MKDVLKRVFQQLLIGAALGFGLGLWAGPLLVRGEYAMAAGVVSNPCTQTAYDAVSKVISYILFLGIAGSLATPLIAGLVGNWWKKRKAAQVAPPAPPAAPAT